NPKLDRTKAGTLVAGQSVLVPTAAVLRAAVSLPEPSIERYPRSTGRDGTHIVRSGETLGGIARRYGTTTRRLMELNALRRELIFPGQSLVVPGKPAAHKAALKAPQAKPRTPSDQ